MARVIRNTDPAVVELATMVNDLKAYVAASMRNIAADMTSIASDSVAFATPAAADPGAHNDRAEKLIASADGSGTLATSLVLTNELLAWYAWHMADTLAHKVAGVALTSYTPATSLATAYTVMNDLKAKYNTHRASTTYHYTADGTNVIAAADANSQGSLDTLINELKADLNLHAASGVSAKSVRLVAA